MQSDDVTDLRVAIVHERFTEVGGSERCVEQFHRLWPNATIHAAVLDRTALPDGLRDATIEPTSLQRVYRGGSIYAYLLPLLPLAISRIDVGDVDLVITSHHAFSNRVRPPKGVPVVSYTHTPARWMWEPTMLDNEIGGPVGRTGLRAFGALQRGRDRRAAARLTGVVVNSHHVADRVRRWWGRAADVVHPPVDAAFFTPDPAATREDFFLLAGRLTPYKQPELAVQAAVQAGVRLVVAGDGRSRAAVEAATGPGVEILGAVDDDTLRDLFRRCRALVFPGIEDFGIVPVEAQACGAPVIARGVGGALDSVVEGRTGMFFTGDGPGPLAAALSAFAPERFDPAESRRQALRFSPDRFRDRFSATVARILAAETGPT